MPDTIRISGSCAYPWRRGIPAAIAGTLFPFPVHAKVSPEPRGALPATQPYLPTTVGRLNPVKLTVC